MAYAMPLRKRAALVIATVLGLTSFAVAMPAQAAAPGADNLFSCTAALNTTTCTQSVGNVVLLTNKALDENLIGAADDDSLEVTATSPEYFQNTTYYIEVTGGTIASVNDNANAGSPDADMVLTKASDTLATLVVAADVTDSATIAAGEKSIALTASAAGTMKVTVYYFASGTGVKTTQETFDIAWVASSTLDLASISVTTLPGNDAANCAIGNTNAAHNSIIWADSDDATNSTADDVDLCVRAVDGNGNGKAAAVSIVGSGIGLINGAAVAADTAAGNFSDGVQQYDLTGNGLAGTSKWTVTVTAGTITKTATIDVVFIGEIATITLSNDAYSLDDDAAATDAIRFSIKDENGIPLAGGTQNSGAELLVDSDIASAVTIDVVGEEDAAAAVIVKNAATGPSTVSKLAVETKGIITVDCVDGSYESMTVRMRLTNANAVAITSNEVTVYCSENTAAAGPEITVADATVGSSQVVEAKVTADITGKTYPIADGVTVNLATTGGTFTNAAPVTVNGVAKSTLAAPAINGTYAVTALVATDKSATKTFKVTGSTIADQTTVAALQEQITALSASVTTLIAALSKQVKRLQAAITKLRKQVRAL